MIATVGFFIFVLGVLILLGLTWYALILRRKEVKKLRNDLHHAQMTLSKIDREIRTQSVAQTSDLFIIETILQDYYSTNDKELT